MRFGSIAIPYSRATDPPAKARSSARLHRSLVAASLVWAAPWEGAAAQGDQEAAQCANRGRAYDMAARIGGCSAIIKAKRVGRAALASAYYNRGVAYGEQGDDPRAIADYSEAIRLDPRDAQALMNRGNSLARQGDYQGALADQSEAIGLTPQEASFHFNRGKTNLLKRDLARAVADFGEAIRLQPQGPEAYLMRAQARAHLGDSAGGLADARQAGLLATGDWRMPAAEAVMHLMMGDAEKAIATATRSIALDPNQAPAYRVRGAAYERLNQPERAIADFREVLLRASDDQLTRAALCRLLTSSDPSSDATRAACGAAGPAAR